MIHPPTRRDLFLYGLTTAAASVLRAQSGRHSGSCVSWLHNHGCVLGQGLVAFYDFVPGADPQVLYDRSGNGYHGQLGSTTGADTNDPAWLSPRGLQFGGHDYVTLPSSLPSMNNIQFTAMMRMSLQASSGYILTRGPSPLGDGWGISPVDVTTRYNGGNAYSMSYATALPTDGTVFTLTIVGGYSTTSAQGTSFRAYSSLTDITGSETKTAAARGDEAKIPYIGRRDYGTTTYLSGTIYSLAWWARALPVAEIARMVRVI